MTHWSSWVAWWSVNHVMFTCLGYPLSYLEFIGTVINFLCVWLVVRKSIWTWPIGNLAAILFAVLFYQIRLYSDLVQQFYFLATNCYGWWIWLKRERIWKRENDTREGITTLSWTQNGLGLAITVAGTLALGRFMTHVHDWWPRLFHAPAAFPYTDAWETTMTFIAQILMARKKLECWIYWVVVDVVSIGLYFSRGVAFVGVLYIVFLGMAIQGFFIWRKTWASVPGLAA